MSWWSLIALAVGAYGCKILGVAVLARVMPADDDPAAATHLVALMASLIPAALFSALIAVQTFELDGALSIDARTAGVAASAVAVWRRAPFVLVIGVAMAVTAAIRWQT